MQTCTQIGGVTVWDWCMSSRIIDYNFQGFQPIADSLAQLSYMMLWTFDHWPDSSGEYGKLNVRVLLQRLTTHVLVSWQLRVGEARVEGATMYNGPKVCVVSTLHARRAACTLGNLLYSAPPALSALCSWPLTFAQPQCVNASRQNYRGDYGLMRWYLRLRLSLATTPHQVTLSLNTFPPFDAVFQFKLSQISSFPLHLATRSGSSRPCLLHCCLHWLAFSRTTTWAVCSSSLLRDRWHHNFITVSIITAVGHDYGEL